jgi:ubiquitin C-terminal hydrolase
MLVMLQTADTRAWSTQDLTKSFGWSDNNGREQQDIHELNRVLVDAIEQALSGTPYESLIRELYFGELTSVIMCLECGNARKRPEPLLDLMLTVKGFKNVQESMNDLFSFQTFDGDDKLTCDYCGVKTAS